MVVCLGGAVLQL